MSKAVDKRRIIFFGICQAPLGRSEQSFRDRAHSVAPKEEIGYLLKELKQRSMVIRLGPSPKMLVNSTANI